MLKLGVIAIKYLAMVVTLVQRLLRGMVPSSAVCMFTPQTGTLWANPEVKLSNAHDLIAPKLQPARCKLADTLPNDGPPCTPQCLQFDARMHN